MVQRVHKYADGGKVRKSEVSYGSPIGVELPKTRGRPKVGDKDPTYKPGARRPPKKTPRKPPSSKPYVNPKHKPTPADAGSTFRDYRGVDGAVDDAEKGT